MTVAIETTIGTAPVLKIRSGSAPADVATADSGTVLATLTLPSDWAAAASAVPGVGQDVSILYSLHHVRHGTAQSTPS